MKPGHAKMVLLPTVLVFIFAVRYTTGCGRKPPPPPPPNKPPSISCSPVKPSNVVASSGKTEAVVTWKLPTASDPEDGGTKISLKSGKGPGSSFGRGSHTVIYSTSDSKGLQAYCFITFTVQVVECPYPSWPRHGSAQCDKNIYGSSCTFNCYEGYKLTGSRKRTCQRDGKYSGTLTQCVAKECPKLPLPPNGLAVICTNRNFFKSVCWLTCNEKKGYTAKRGQIAQCLEGQSWSFSALSCEDSRPPAITNCPTETIHQTLEKNLDKAVVKWPKLIGSDNSGSFKITQTRGLPSGSAFPKGISNIQFDIQDNAVPPNKGDPCVFAVIVEALECPAPPFSGKYLSLPQCHPPFTQGKYCALECSFSIPMVGKKGITCEKSSTTSKGEWDWGQFKNKSAVKPHCSEKECRDLRTPQNGAMACDKWLAGRFCQMSCEEPYDIPDDAEYEDFYVCGSSTGTWKPSSNVADCTEKREPFEFKNMNAHNYYKGDCNDESVKEQIRQNYMTALQQSGTWYFAACVQAKKHCRAENVEVTCGQRAAGKRRRRSAKPNWFSVSFELVVDVKKEIGKTVEANVADSEKVLRDAAKRIWSHARAGKMAVIVSGKKLIPNRLRRYASVPICHSGQKRAMFSKKACVPCPRGTYHNKVRDQCSACALGMYQNEKGTLACKACPAGTTTLTLAAMTDEKCIKKCLPGSYSANGVVPCFPCQRGEYQPNSNSVKCEKCPVGKTTVKTGATSVSACIPFDIMMDGPATVDVSARAGANTCSFTFSSWIKLGYRAEKGMSFLVRHPFKGLEVSVDIAKSIRLWMTKDIATVPDTISVEKWTHVAVVWSKGSVQIYKSGRQILSRQVSGAPTCPIHAFARMRIIVRDNADVFLADMHLFPVVKTPKDISALANACNNPVKDMVFSIGHINADTLTNVFQVTPSSCSGTDYCASEPCGDNLCVSRHDGYHCKCQGGYSGPNCKNPPNFCKDNTCRNGATCVVEQNQYRCTCAPGYKGQICDEKIVNGGWGNWTDWSGCSVTCGNGMKVRRRSCDSPPPDPEGLACKGSKIESATCVEEKCPECDASQLLPGHGVIPTCKKFGSNVDCKIACGKGLVFAQHPPVYRCRTGQWVPSLRTISCTVGTSPEVVGINYTMTYQVPNSLRKSKTEIEIVKKHLRDFGQNFQCFLDEKCRYKLEVTESNNGVRAQMLVGKAIQPGDINLYKLQQSNSELYSFVSDTWTLMESTDEEVDSSRQLHSVLEGLKQQRLSKTFSNLLKSWEIFEATNWNLESQNFSDFDLLFNNDTVNISPTSFVAKQMMKCPSGSMQGKTFCVECAPGTFFSDGKCRFCDMGFFQDKPGQLSCEPCSGFTATKFGGSIEEQECLEDSDIKTSFSLVTDGQKSIHVLDMSNTKTRSIAVRDNVVAADYNAYNNDVYYVTKDTHMLRKVDLSGSQNSAVYTFKNDVRLSGVAVDPATGLIYYTDSNGVIGALTIDGNVHVEIIDKGLISPRDIVLDKHRLIMYWVEGRKILQANYDGSGKKIVVTDSDTVWGLTLDVSEQQLFWFSRGRLRTINTDRTDRLTLIQSESAAFGITNKYFYFINHQARLIRRNKDGSGSTTLLDLSSKISLNAVVRLRKYTPQKDQPINNICSKNKGGCSHMCFPFFTQTRVCACPTDYTLKVDSKTCRKDMSSSLTTPLTDDWTFLHLIQNGFYVNDRTSFRFKVKACSSARVALIKDKNDRYEIKLGELSNNVSSIMKCTKAWKICVRMKEAINPVLNCKQYKSFWISWNNSIVKVGTGENIGVGEIIVARDSNMLTVNSLAVSTGKKIIGAWQV